jgi:hypothetical protein
LARNGGEEKMRRGGRVNARRRVGDGVDAKRIT